MLDKDFLELGNTEKEYNTRSSYAGGELQSFIDEMDFSSLYVSMYLSTYETRLDWEMRVFSNGD